MDIEIFSLCDHAQDFQGKLVIVGTFDTIWAKKFPSMHPSCALAARIRFTAEEAGRHALNLLIVDMDGRNIVPPLTGELNVARPRAGDTVTVNFVITIGQLRFQKPGRYSIDFLIDNTRQRSLPLLVNQAQAPPKA
jgi:hypothetical protein